MSGSLLEVNPFGQGNTRASRECQRPFDANGSSIAYTEWEPRPYQAPLLSIDKGVILAAGALGAGKSEPGAEQLIRWAFRYPRRKDGRPTKWYVIGPDFSLIKQEQFGKLLEHLRKVTVPGFRSLVKRVVYGQDPRIILAQDQVILGRSATDPDRLRGHEVDGYWGDEVQKWPEKAFRIATSRCRSAAAIRIVLTGSPEDSPAWVWRMLSGEDEGYNKLRAALKKKGAGFYAFRWHSRQNTTNEAGVLDVVQAALDASAAGVSAQELEGKFPATHEAPSLGVLNHSRAFVGKVQLDARDAQPSSLGVDIGESEDFTWLVVLSSTGVVLHMERFNANSPGVPRATFHPWLEDRVHEVAARWGVKTIVVDSAKAGKPMAQSLLRKSGEGKIRGQPRVLPYDTSTGRKKHEAIESLMLALSRADVRIPSTLSIAGKETKVAEEPQLRKEFEELVVVDHGNGKRSFDHPHGAHDDGVVSLALAWHGLETNGGSGGQLADLSTLLPRQGEAPRYDAGGASPFGGRGGGYTF